MEEGELGEDAGEGSEAAIGVYTDDMKDKCRWGEDMGISLERQSGVRVVER